MDEEERRQLAELVRDNPAEHRYELPVDGFTAVLEYARRPDVIVLYNTVVPEQLRGRGLGGVLAAKAIESASGSGVRVVVRCPFIRSWLEKNPEYRRLIRPSEGQSES